MVARESWRCVITEEGTADAEYGIWRGFESVHIFPLAYEGYWDQHGYSRWVTIQSDTGESINSVQNEMLLREDVHTLFDSYYP